MTSIDLMAALKASLRQNDPIPPHDAIEVIERVPNGHAYDCERGPGSHAWRRLDPNEASLTPDAEFICDDCTALGVMVRPHGVAFP